MARPLNRLPPLNALRAFVVAAKHLSFTKAAADLFVTPAAVSQQVKQLEDHLGCALFRRTNRALLLTDEGQVAKAECTCPRFRRQGLKDGPCAHLDVGVPRLTPSLLPVRQCFRSGFLFFA